MIKLKEIKRVEIKSSFIELIKLTMPNIVEHREERGGNGNACKTWRFYLDKGFDIFLTRMKQLPYESFEGIKSHGKYYFKATTEPLTVDYKVSDKSMGLYDIGRYSIYLPTDSLMLSQLDGIHLIPHSKDMATRDGRYYRHMHHLAYKDTYSIEGNPLTQRANTCWGSIGSIMIMTMEDLDLPEIFRALYLFVTIQNGSSPLVHISGLDHYHYHTESE